MKMTADVFPSILVILLGHPFMGSWLRSCLETRLNRAQTIKEKG